MVKFLKPYVGYTSGFLSYKLSIYIMSEFFNIVDHIIDTNQSDNIKALPKGNNNLTPNSGGQNDLLPIGAVGIVSQSLTRLKNFGAKSTFIIIRPIAELVGYLLLEIPMLKGIYDTIKTGKVILASMIALGSIRLIARFDYWVIILINSIPQLPINDKSVLVSICRMRMGAKYMHICLPQSNDVINLVMDTDIILEEKVKVLVNFFSLYNYLPDNSLLKNRHFACIIHVLLALFIGNKISFRLALRLLLRLLKDGKISLETYREIVSQLILGGVPSIELQIEAL